MLRLEQCDKVDISKLPEESNENSNRKKTNPSSIQENMRLKPIVLEDPAIMRQKVRSLSYEQRIVFDMFINYCKCISIKGDLMNPEPPCIIVHGKSKLLNIQTFVVYLYHLYYHFLLFFDKLKQNISPKCLKCFS